MGGYQCRFLAISCGPCSFIPSSFQGALHSLKRMHLSISRIVSVKRGWVTSLRVRAHSPHPAPARSEQRSARSTLPWLLVAATERCGGTLSGYTVLGAGQLLRHLPPPPHDFEMKLVQSGDCVPEMRKGLGCSPGLPLPSWGCWW